VPSFLVIDFYRTLNGIINQSINQSNGLTLDRGNGVRPDGDDNNLTLILTDSDILYSWFDIV